MMQERHQPQVSKKETAIKELFWYFQAFLIKTSVGRTTALNRVAQTLAEDAYRIVKKAEGFEVED